MKNLIWATLLLGSELTAAHTVFSKVSRNYGPVSNVWQYIRQVDNGPEYNGEYYVNYAPIYDLYSNDIRCGWGGTTKGKGVETLAVNAGDTLSFYSTQWNGTVEKDSSVYHQGPVQAYLSPVSGSLEDATGDGDWFKIGSFGWVGGNKSGGDLGEWAAYHKPYVNFTIPKTTPPSKYLMRVELIFPYSQIFNTSQNYVNCAHIEVNGEGGGTPGPMVKFPGAYDNFDPSLWVTWKVAYSLHPQSTLPGTSYKAPGPEVWTG